jgi:hypothetical protein
VDDRVGKVDERTVKMADRGAMRLEGLEEKMKQLEQAPADPVGGGKEEQFTKEREAKSAVTDGTRVI